MATVTEVSTDAEYAVAGRLIAEYLQGLPFEVNFQDIDVELTELPLRYGPPRGAAFLAWDGGSAVGVVLLRDLGHGIGEIKRMYVTPAARGQSVGRRLTETLIDRARALGYERLRLDTVTSLVEANRLYERLGFVDIPAYNDNPRPDVRFMELLLDP